MTVYCPPTIYGLLPEPGPEVTDLWDATGRHYFRIPPQAAARRQLAAV